MTCGTTQRHTSQPKLWAFVGRTPLLNGTSAHKQPQDHTNSHECFETGTRHPEAAEAAETEAKKSGVHS